MRPTLIRILGVAAPCLFTACAATVAFRATYDDGSTRSVGQLRAGLQVGEWTHYWPNGKPQARGRYAADLQIGPWTWWYENGRRRVAGAFRDEHSDGYWQYWYPDGQPRMTGFFERGRKAGEWTVYGPDGGLREHGQYAAGQRTGPWEFRHPDGRPKARGWFYRGTPVGTWTVFDAAGQPRQERHPLPDGVRPYREDWPGGGPRRTGFLVADRPAGRWVTYHDSGGRRLVGDFAAGQPVGRWRAFAPAGWRFAEGPVDGRGRQPGWSLWPAAGQPPAPGGDAPAPPIVFGGHWSPAAEFDASAGLAVVDGWLGEACAERTALVGEHPPPAAVSQPAATLGAHLVAPAEPAPPPLFTQRELRSVAVWLRAYTEKMVQDAFSLYDAGARRPQRKDKSRSAALVDRHLQTREFTTAAGRRVQLGQPAADQWVLLVLLRGFAGQVCPYCPVQLRALAPFRDRFARLGVRVVAVYPGPRAGVAGFTRAYQDTFGADLQPPYDILYDEESRLARELGVLETDPASAILARPTVLLLDPTARIRYAYVGRHRADRPPARLLLERIAELRGR